MHLPQSPDFLSICREIAQQVADEGFESLVWSDDMYQGGPFCGGWDPLHQRFFFSYYAPDGIDYWFDVSLDEVHAVTRGEPINPILTPHGPAPSWP